MNIFILDFNPKQCAQMHMDKHCVKMIVETAQLLSTAHHILGINENLPDIYKKTHENHPCAIWVRNSEKNYDWLCQLGIELCKEYTYRYNKTHSCESLIYLFSQFKPKFQLYYITEFALAMPDECKLSQLLTKDHSTFIDYTVASYRNYYIKEKQHIAKWTKRETPNWYKLN